MASTHQQQSQSRHQQLQPQPPTAEPSSSFLLSRPDVNKGQQLGERLLQPQRTKAKSPMFSEEKDNRGKLWLEAPLNNQKVFFSQNSSEGLNVNVMCVHSSCLKWNLKFPLTEE